MGDPTPNPNLVSSPSISNPNPNPSSPAFDYAALQQQQHQALLSPSPGFNRTGSIPRISQMQQQYGAAAAAGAMRMYGSGQMSFSTPQQQQIGRGGQLPMLPGQFNIQPQMLAQQQRGKMGLVQGGQLHSGSSSGQALQGIQSLGMIGGMGMNTQIRANANGNLVYNQQRIASQLRQQPSSSQQTQLTSPQKLQGQTIPRQLSLSAMNPQLSGLTQNGQSALVQSTLSQQQWLKQIPTTMPTAVSPSYHVQQQRQQQAFMQQQLSSSQMLPKSMGLNHQQISQLIQQQPQLATQLHQQQRKHLSLQQQQQLQPLSMQQQQQLSPRMAGPALHNSINLIGSQPGTPVSGGTTGGSATQGIGASNQLLGKRKIQDLVAQVDPHYKLEPEVEDLLLEMADHFIDSVTSFACSIAKHRKSSTLESKDVLLNLEKNWHLSIPGYTRNENKYQRNSGRALNIQQSERDATTAKATVRQTSSDSSVDRSIKPSPSSEHLGIPSNASQMMQKITRF